MKDRYFLCAQGSELQFEIGIISYFETRTGICSVVERSLKKIVKMKNCKIVTRLPNCAFDPIIC
jgi:hypothetical protein